MNLSYYIGTCPFCDNQGRAFIVKEISTKQLLVLCEECDTVWDSPQKFLQNDPNIAKTQNGNRIEDVNFEEIKKEGWDIFIKQ